MEVQRFNTVMIAFSWRGISHYHLTDFNLQSLSLLSIRAIDLCVCVCMRVCFHHRISAVEQLWKLWAPV